MEMKRIWKIQLICLVLLLLSACGETQEPIIIEQIVTRVVEVEKEIVITATPPPTPSTNIIFQDNFEEEGQWHLLDNGNAYYENGRYYLNSQDTSALVQSGNAELLNIDDFMLDVDVSFVTDEDVLGIAIISFRHFEDGLFGGYSFIIANNGHYSLLENNNDQGFLLGGSSKAEIINRGQSNNHIHLEVNGHTIAAYINDELVTYVVDNTFSTGSIRLSTVSNATFDNLVVTSVD